MSTLNVTVRAEYTPNPNSLKFICSETLYPYAKSLTYETLEEAKEAENPIAIKLFAISGLTRIFVMSNFVTIDKDEQINWKDIHLEVKEIIKDELETMKEWAEKNAPPVVESTGEDGDLRVEVERVLDKIRPSLMADGGNIELVDIVGSDARLRMVGACGTCPSSLMTMKMGVERALLSELPGKIESVTQVF
ncbi:MAG: NifU family protein [Candidatus Caenarcaniphilales bacterium]|nr:NifU family protein [Candidatus Caenarcaniphilales bacterium]